MKVVTAAVAAMLVVACASAPQNLQPPDTATVIGSAADQKAFAGLWRGTLEAVDVRLGGPIEFRLQPGSALFKSEGRTPQRILWLRVTEGKVAGATETWFDPVRKADVYSTFEATLVEGTLRGVVREKVGAQWTDVATFTAVRVSD